MTPNKIANVVRADSLVAGEEFYDLILGTGHKWVATADGPDAGSQVRAMSLHDYRVVNFGEAQLVWKL